METRSTIEPTSRAGSRFDRRRLLGAAALAIAASAQHFGTARAAELPAAEVPKTAAGNRLAWLLKTINASRIPSESALKRVFAEDFLAALPVSDLAALFPAYFNPSGPMSLARFEGPTDRSVLSAIVVTPAADWRITLGVETDERHLVNQLFLEPIALPVPTAKATSWKALTRAFAAVAPRASFLAAEIVGGAAIPLASLTPERTLAIGSAFKLYVVGELINQLANGDVTLDELLTIRDDLRSLPNGDMRLLPTGTQLPLLTFVEQMISASDNTATDHLIDRLGRQNIESAFPLYGNAVPARNQPLLMTREWFALKLRLSASEIDTFEAMSDSEKRAYLTDTIDPIAGTLTEEENWFDPYLIEQIEWFASAGDLVRAIASIHHRLDQDDLPELRDAFSITPGLTFSARDWRYVGYKGGYETGVKSETYLLQRTDGRWFALAGIINDERKEIDGNAMRSALVAAVNVLAKTD